PEPSSMTSRYREGVTTRAAMSVERSRSKRRASFSEDGDMVSSLMKVRAVLIAIVLMVITYGQGFASPVEDSRHNDYWLFNRLSEGNSFQQVDGGRTINGP